MKDKASGPGECFTDGAERISELEQRIAELRARLPKHSVPTAMMVELDELEDALRRLRDGLGHADVCR